MTTEPTEHEVRLLLAKAAATIEVDESAPVTLTGLPEPGPRRWPVLAAAAAVVVAIGGGLLVAQQAGDDPQPAPEPATTTPTAPIEEGQVYADDEMPALLGHTRAEAADLLRSRGYVVETRKEHSCDQPAGYVLGTEPVPGTPMEPGDTVRVTITGGVPPAARCAVRTDEWQQVFDLARFARGLGPAPAFPDRVSIAVGEGEYVDLTAEEAADPESWLLCEDDACHSALAGLAEILTRSRVSLHVTDRPLGICRFASPRDQGLPFHLPSFVYVEEPVDGVFCPRPPVVEIGWTEDWHIGAVRLHPADGEPAETEAEPTARRRQAADRFVTWARGDGPAPDFADRVRLLSPGFHPGWVDEPEDRSRYAGCSGLGFPDCGIDPVAAVFRAEGRVDAYAGRPHCGFAGAYPSRYVEADEVHLVVADAQPGRCPALVQLWITAGGEIYRLAQVGLPPG